ncbi:hypothetical protein Cgig2_023154 [Carnegiea gigantea]|uniref:Uncharacterized protein n=1 Tax=Carnegiea gigantea TaxID=171969 RepID=A0A9Q1KDN0_9CARY|nr:hypothetical protein Cgig2_023154 [Carnegiea gigantea]
MPVAPRGNVFDTNMSKDEGKLGSKTKLKIIRSRKPLEPFLQPMEDGSSRIKIPGIDVVIPATPFPAIPIERIALIEKLIELAPKGADNIIDILDAEPNLTECVEESNVVNFKNELAHVPLPSGSQCFPSIRRIPSFGKDLFDSRLRLEDLKGVCSPDDDEVESICRANVPLLVPHAQCPLRGLQGGISVFNANAVIKEVSSTPFDGLSSLKRNFDNLYTTILQRGVDITPLENKDLQQSYSSQTFAEEYDSCRMEVQDKIDKASRRLNTEGTHHNIKTAELNSQGQIDILNAIEVMDAAPKASLEKDEAYIKESFEDLKNFQ